MEGVFFSKDSSLLSKMPHAATTKTRGMEGQRRRAIKKIQENFDLSAKRRQCHEKFLGSRFIFQMLRDSSHSYVPTRAGVSSVHRQSSIQSLTVLGRKSNLRRG